MAGMGKAIDRAGDGPQGLASVACVAYVAVLVLVTALLASVLADSAPDHDAIQALGAAQSLAAGTGYASPIPYYRLQHAAAPTLPVPQTIFPPGGAFALRAALAVGVPAALAPMAVALLALLVSVEAMRRLLRSAGCPPAIAVAVALGWLAHPRIWELVRSGSTEPAYVAAGLLATLGVVRASGANRPLPWLLAAGLAAAAAVLLRYVGAVHVAALTAVVALLFRGGGLWRRLRFAAVFALPAALATVAMLVRNRQLSGRLSGGQFEHPSPPGWGEALAAMFDAMRMAAGLPSVPWASGAALAAGVAALLAATAWALPIVLARGDRRQDAARGGWGGAPDAERRQAAARVVLACVVGAAAQAAFLAWNAATASAWFASWRYLLPLLPLCVVAVVAFVAALADGTRAGLSPRAQGVALAAVALLAAGLALRVHGSTTPLAEARTELRLALDARCGEETVRQRIEHQRAAGLPILSTEEHLLQLETGAWVIGTTSRFYTRREWTPAAVAALMASFGAREAVVLRTMLPRRAPAFVGSPFHEALSAGGVPDGFESVCQTDGVAVLRAPRPTP
jgi:hypothetical protein